MLSVMLRGWFQSAMLYALVALVEPTGQKGWYLLGFRVQLAGNGRVAWGGWMVEERPASCQ